MFALRGETQLGVWRKKVVSVFERTARFLISFCESAKLVCARRVDWELHKAMVVCVCLLVMCTD